MVTNSPELQFEERATDGVRVKCIIWLAPDMRSSSNMILKP